MTGRGRRDARRRNRKETGQSTESVEKSESLAGDEHDYTKGVFGSSKTRTD